MKTHLTITLSLFFFLTINAQIYVKHDATGNEEGTSWEDAYTNPQDAFDNAEAGDQIWIADGVYKPQNSASPDTNTFLVIQPLEIYGGFAGTETMLSERDWLNNTTTFSGDINGDDVDDNFTNFRNDNTRHVFRVFSQSGMVIIDGLTITNGQTRIDDIPTNTTDYSPWRGGGLEIIAEAEVRNCTFKQCDGDAGSAFWTISTTSGTTVVLENCIIENNRSQQGAAVFLAMNSPIIRGCHFENNMSTTYGGGITFGNTNGFVEDCIFQGNSAPSSIGGGVFVFQNSFNTISNPTIEIQNCEFIENEAFAGGGITFNNFFPGSNITIDSCNFFQNVSPIASQGGGGGILLQNFQDNFGGGIPSMNAEISNCTLIENISNDGGGAYFYSASDTMNLTITNTEFNNNDAGSGGGAIFMENSNSLIHATYQNNTFTANTSDFGGGAIAMINDAGVSRLTYDMDNCTFTGNRSAYCGAMWTTINSAGSFGAIGTITNSHFSENTGSQCCGAIGSLAENITIDNTTFTDNSTAAMDTTLPGGGAIFFRFAVDANVLNSTFTENSSDVDGAAILVQEGDRVRLENVLLNDNEGSSTISNEDSLWMVNVTMDKNDFGILQKNGGYLEIQNSILNNLDFNYQESGTTEVITKGGNISSDNTLSTYLTDFGTYNDFNETDPELDLNFVPEQSSLAIDTGNPNGITTTLDLAGENRIQGNEIDAGAYESPFTTSLKELEQLEIEIYPNPFIDNINISNIESIDAIRLLDILGKVIQSFPVKNVLTINQNLPKGIYVLEIKIENQLFLKKLEKH